jgi:hypothetical protein
VEVVVALVAIQQTPLHQIVWSNVPVMGIIERPLVQQSIPVRTTQPTIEVALTCAYCQQVEDEFKNCPFVDDKLKILMRE